MNQRTVFGFAKSTLYGASLILSCAVCFALGYLQGWEDRSHKLKATAENIDGLSDLPETPQVRPSQAQRLHLPPSHPPMPMVDQHGHPTFECRAIKTALPKTKNELNLNDLFSKRVELSKQKIKMKALVVGVYPNILDLNWFHLCDAPKGQVLVVSSKQQAEIGSIVQVEGLLEVDYDLKGIYQFPLFISEANLQGEYVTNPPEETPMGTFKL